MYRVVSPMRNSRQEQNKRCDNFRRYLCALVAQHPASRHISWHGAQHPFSAQIQTHVTKGRLVVLSTRKPRIAIPPGMRRRSCHGCRQRSVPGRTCPYDRPRADAAVATTSENTTVSIWNVDSGERISGPLSHRSEVHRAVFIPNSDLIATASGREGNTRPGATRIEFDLDLDQ